MQVLLIIITVLVELLIAVGDLVLFLINRIFKNVLKILQFPFITLFAVTRLISGIFKKLRLLNFSLNKYLPHKKIVIKIEPGKKLSKKRGASRPSPDKVFFPKIKISFAFLKFFLRKTKLKKPKKVRQVTVFPTPFSLKFKYIFIGSFFSLIFIFLPLLFFIFLQNLPNPSELSTREVSQTTKIFDRNGNLLYQIYANQNRTSVSLNSVPENLINATIAIEDKDFYKNPGFDLNAIGRAAYADLTGKPLQGGSTITQQLIKSTLLTPEISIERKIKEIILAFWAERIYTKNQILEMYFNQVPYGGTAWGVEAAAQTYFDKPVNELNLAQCAFLAGMPQAPSIYTPYGENPNLWKKRQKEVLTRMKELGYITKNQQKQAEEEIIAFLPAQTPIRAPHFVMYIKELLVKKYGLPMVEKGGLNVTTSLDLKIQDMAQEIVKNEVDKNAYLNLSNGAVLVTDPRNGDILAMVGSKNYNNNDGGNVNVTISKRQPGSSIKVVTYAAALMNGFTAATILDDTPVSYGNPGAPVYSPVNYDGKFHGKVPLRIALGNSFNIPAVKTLNKIGIPTMVYLGKKMGITTWGKPIQYGLAITLGAAEVKMTDMASVYGILANQGKKVSLNPVLKITNHSGNMLEIKENIDEEQVIPPGVAFILSSILADNSARAIEFGTNSPLQIAGRVVSVKTGTSDNKRDNWTIGYTPSLLVAAWVGNNNNSPMSQQLASGITGAAPIWHEIMANLISKNPSENITVPTDVIAKSCYGRVEYFLKNSQNLVFCPPASSSAALAPPNQTKEDKRL